MDCRNRRHRTKSPESVFAVLLFLVAAIGFAQQPTNVPSVAPVGIPRDLAKLRAQQLKDVRYQLSFTITPKTDFVNGHEELRFVQNADDRGILPEGLDFREGSISSLTVNGQPASTEIQNGHVELPAKLLKLGENLVVIDFKAPVAPAGKAITRFEDKDDGSEYIYTLFVPMDADMAFPCFDQPDLKAKFKLSVTAPAGLDGRLQHSDTGKTAGLTKIPQRLKPGRLSYSNAGLKACSTPSHKVAFLFSRR